MENALELGENPVEGDVTVCCDSAFSKVVESGPAVSPGAANVVANDEAPLLLSQELPGHDQLVVPIVVICAASTSVVLE